MPHPAFLAGVLALVGVVFLVAAALNFAATPVAALFYAALGLGLLVPGAAMTLGVAGVAVTLPAAFGLAVIAVVLQSLGV